jgi:hypothetical protein
MIFLFRVAALLEGRVGDAADMMENIGKVYSIALVMGRCGHCLLVSTNAHLQLQG